jgi:hypothetical protein
MTLPGFSAETSLYKTTVPYRLVGASVQAGGAVPQQVHNSTSCGPCHLDAGACVQSCLICTPRFCIPHLRDCDPSACRPHCCPPGFHCCGDCLPGGCVPDPFGNGDGVCVPLGVACGDPASAGVLPDLSDLRQ